MTTDSLQRIVERNRALEIFTAAIALRVAPFEVDISNNAEFKNIVEQVAKNCLIAAQIGLAAIEGRSEE